MSIILFYKLKLNIFCDNFVVMKTILQITISSYLSLEKRKKKSVYNLRVKLSRIKLKLKRDDKRSQRNIKKGASLNKNECRKTVSPKIFDHALRRCSNSFNSRTLGAMSKGSVINCTVP